MKRHFILCLTLCTVFVSTAPTRAMAQPEEYSEAVALFENGMYQRAREIFARHKGDPLCEDYVTLCALRMRTNDCERLASSVDEHRPKTVLNSAIHWEYALMLFEKGSYSAAQVQFEKVNSKGLDTEELGEYWFKQGFCSFNIESFGKATEYFTKAAEYNTPYTYPSYFALGIIDYNHQNFAPASEWFERSVEDPRFYVLSSFYLVDCHFMAHDYDYVIRRGESIYDKMPPERQKHLSRILSESYLVKGDAVSARKYLSISEDMDNADYFRAGSVFYAIGDYRGAIQNFEKMTCKTDSLAQIAAYQQAYSYIKLKNKVSALDCFKAASALRFDESIEEDAFFNYAKLSFDLNGDESVFKAYLDRFGMDRKGEMIYDYLAMSALSRKDYAGAVKAYDEIDELSDEQKSNYIKANFLRAQQLLSVGSYSASVPYLKAAAYYLPKSDQFGQLCKYSLANTYYVSDAYKEALTVYNDLYNLSALYGRSEGALLPYNIAYCFFKQGDYVSSARWFDNYLSTKDSLARRDALVRRADCDFARKDYRAAARIYRRAVEEFPDKDSLYPYYYMGVACGMSGDKAGRVEALSAVLAASPSTAYYCETLYELGRAYSDMGDKVNAVQVFDLLQARATSDDYIAKALIGKGMVKRNAGELNASLECYKELVAKMPKSTYVSDALLSIQSIYTALKTPEKYIEYLEANKLSTGRTEAEKRDLYFNTAEQVFLAGNYSGAVNSFNKFLTMYPDGKQVAESYYYIAASYKNLGQGEKACEYYRKAIGKGLSGSFEEFALMDYAAVSYRLQHYNVAYDSYIALTDTKYTMTGKVDAYTGAMRSAYRAQMYEKTIDAAASLLKLSTSKDLRREAMYDQAKSYLSLSQRDKAFELLGKLISEPDTAEGAESYYLIIQARFDWGHFEDVENGVFDFASKCTSQPYWLAKAFIVLGDSYVERNMTEQAKATYRSVADGYEPSGEGDDILQVVEHKLAGLQ